LHEAYVHRTRKGRPLTTLRLAIYADGMIARKDGAPLELMSETSRDFIGLQRALSDAVLVGARTAELDDPPLTPGLKGLGDRAYARIVLVGRKVPPTGLQLLAPGHPVWVLCERGKDFGLPPPVEFITVEGKNGRPDLKKAMALLGQRGVSSLLVEGGARLTEAMLAAELADRLLLIETPAEVGRAGLPATPLGGIHGRLRAAGFVETGTRELGPDRLLTYDRQF
jgi:diaminohydroxyphosphoribosylaminopyrimidine deaminase/5-amino-6-(5-phosphoribosylamino)uracil reductase